MKPLSTLLCSATAFSCAAGGPSRSAPAGGPETAVQAYFRASDTASSKLLRQAFLPAAQLQWVDDQGHLQLLTQLGWWQRLDANAAPVPALDRRLVLLDREGPFALMEAVSTWTTHVFDDLLLVAETPDGWRIVGKVFEKLPPTPAPPPTATDTQADEQAIRAILARKIEAHATYDPALLDQTHTPQCLYVAIGAPAPFLSTLSEAAARYAARRDAGETDPDSRWRILAITIRGHIAAAKLDVLYQGRRYIDHLLLLRLAEGWRIAAAAWGDPTFQPAARPPS